MVPASSPILFCMFLSLPDRRVRLRPGQHDVHVPPSDTVDSGSSVPSLAKEALNTTGNGTLAHPFVGSRVKVACKG
jgi:hypothetical protein